MVGPWVSPMVWLSTNHGMENHVDSPDPNFQAYPYFYVAIFLEIFS